MPRHPHHLKHKRPPTEIEKQLAEGLDRALLEIIEQGYEVRLNQRGEVERRPISGAMMRVIHDRLCDVGAFSRVEELDPIRQVMESARARGWKLDRDDPRDDE